MGLRFRRFSFRINASLGEKIGRRAEIAPVLLFFGEASSIGPLLIIGGHEDKTGDRVVLKRAAELAHASSRPYAIGVVTTASVQGEPAYHQYRSLFRELGVPEVIDLTIDSRDEAQREDMLDRGR